MVLNKALVLKSYAFGSSEVSDCSAMFCESIGNKSDCFCLFAFRILLSTTKRGYTDCSLVSFLLDLLGRLCYGCCSLSVP
jgi:hypothetical protein